jgi:hypothetical protein
MENVSASVAWILHAIANTRLSQCFFQASGTACAGMTIRKSVDRFQTVMAGQRLQGAPAASSRRPILDPTVGRDVDFPRHHRRAEEHQPDDRDGIQGSEHGKILFPRSVDLSFCFKRAKLGGMSASSCSPSKCGEYYSIGQLICNLDCAPRETRAHRFNSLSRPVFD